MLLRDLQKGILASERLGVMFLQIWAPLQVSDPSYDDLSTDHRVYMGSSDYKSGERLFCLSGKVENILEKHFNLKC